MKGKNKKVYLEFLRIIAAFLVIFNHNIGFHLYKTNCHAIMRLFYIFCSVVSKISVPLFFMISGSLLLDKEESLKTLYKKRIGKILLALLFASFAIYLYNVIDKNQSFIISEFIQKMISGNITVEYWYLYAYLGVLIMLPFLKCLVRSMKNMDYKYLFILRIVMKSLIPIVIYLSGILFDIKLSLSPNFNIAFATVSCIFYMLMGYYIDKKIDIEKLTKNQWIQLIGAFIGATFITIGFIYYDGMKNGFNQNFIQLFDYVIAISTFIFVKYIFVHRGVNSKIQAVIIFVGNLTFGIYLLEPLFRVPISKVVNILYQINMPVLVVSFIYCVVAMMICGLITYILKHIPGIRKIV